MEFLPSDVFDETEFSFNQVRRTRGMAAICSYSPQNRKLLRDYSCHLLLWYMRRASCHRVWHKIVSVGRNTDIAQAFSGRSILEQRYGASETSRGVLDLVGKTTHHKANRRQHVFSSSDSFPAPGLSPSIKAFGHDFLSGAPPYQLRFRGKGLLWIRRNH